MDKIVCPRTVPIKKTPPLRVTVPYARCTLPLKATTCTVCTVILCRSRRQTPPYSTVLIPLSAVSLPLKATTCTVCTVILCRSRRQTPPYSTVPIPHSTVSLPHKAAHSTILYGASTIAYGGAGTKLTRECRKNEYNEHLFEIKHDLPMEPTFGLRCLEKRNGNIGSVSIKNIPKHVDTAHA
ncbi:hypothetical protein BJV82DRAFT_113980 [Fennellomyces sp. T-0311]|nr:hypothetical protein BJV82DRAFT_113980 [Fennellomyces sp. T-0311]